MHDTSDALSWLIGWIFVGGIVGGWIGSVKNCFARGVIAGVIFGPFGWLLTAILPEGMDEKLPSATGAIGLEEYNRRHPVADPKPKAKLDRDLEFKIDSALKPLTMVVLAGVNFRCPKCGQIFEAGAEYRGRKVETSCPCGAKLAVEIPA